MPRREATPEEKAQARTQIRKAAAAVYIREGLSAMSVRSIAKEAGVSVGTIYTYFGSVQGLMESLWSRPVTQMSEKLQRLADEIEDPVERIRTLLEAYIQFARDNANIYRGVFLYVRPLGKPSQLKDPAEDAVFPALLIRAIGEGQAQGQIRDGNPSDYAMKLWGSLHGCLALPNNFGRLEFEAPESITDGLVDLLVTALRK